MPVVGLVAALLLHGLLSAPIALAQGGDIDFRNMPGEGCRFIITVPAADEPGVEPTGVARPESIANNE